MARHASAPVERPDFTPNYTGSGLEDVRALAERGIDQTLHLQNARKRDFVLHLTKDDEDDKVFVVCTTDLGPWTHEKKLRRNETAEVPRKIALLMQRNGHVVITGEVPKPEPEPAETEGEEAPKAPRVKRGSVPATNSQET
jgi:hypothetical protein